MLDPFKLPGKFLVMVIVISGYFVVFSIQLVWYIVTRRTDKICDAFGYLGRGAIDAIADFFRQ